MKKAIIITILIILIPFFITKIFIKKEKINYK